jgi:hypothetical protein
MTRLPYDTSRCSQQSGPCPHRQTCLRRTPGHPTYQVYSIYPGGAECHGLIDAEGRQ